MSKGTHFIGQPLYSQLINLLDKSKILVFSRNEGGEHYVKHFDGWQHLVVMLYAEIKRIKRKWSFSGMATIVRIMLIYYINCYIFLEQQEKYLDLIIQLANESPLEPSLFL